MCLSSSTTCSGAQTVAKFSRSAFTATVFTRSGRARWPIPTAKNPIFIKFSFLKPDWLSHSTERDFVPAAFAVAGLRPNRAPAARVGRSRRQLLHRFDFDQVVGKRRRV